MYKFEPNGDMSKKRKQTCDSESDSESKSESNSDEAPAKRAKFAKSSLIVDALMERGLRLWPKFNPTSGCTRWKRGRDTRNEKEAVECFRAAAAMGSKHAVVQLARCEKDGDALQDMLSDPTYGRCRTDIWIALCVLHIDREKFGRSLMTGPLHCNEGAYFVASELHENIDDVEDEVIKALYTQALDSAFSVQAKFCLLLVRYWRTMEIGMPLTWSPDDLATITALHSSLTTCMPEEEKETYSQHSEYRACGIGKTNFYFALGLRRWVNNRVEFRSEAIPFLRKAVAHGSQGARFQLALYLRAQSRSLGQIGDKAVIKMNMEALTLLRDIDSFFYRYSHVQELITKWSEEVVVPASDYFTQLDQVSRLSTSIQVRAVCPFADDVINLIALYCV